MSTRSSILFEAKDGSVTSAFCHWDGYPHDGGVGENLLFYWKDPDKVRNLVQFGYLDKIRDRYAGIVLNDAARLKHKPGHFYVPRFVDYKKEEFIHDNRIAQAANMDSFLKTPCTWDQRLEEYIYLYRESEQAWYFWRSLKGEPVPLDVAIANAYIDNIRDLYQAQARDLEVESYKDYNSIIKSLYQHYVEFRKSKKIGCTPDTVQSPKFQSIVQKLGKTHYKVISLCPSKSEDDFLANVVKTKSIHDLLGLPAMGNYEYSYQADSFNEVLLCMSNTFANFLLLDKGEWFADSFWFKEPVKLADYLNCNASERDQFDLSLQIF